MPKSLRRQIVLAASVVLASVAPFSTHAALTLTAQGITDGFALSTVVTNGFAASYGPLGQAILPNGNFITGSAFGPAGPTLYIFKDVDGQTIGDAVAAIPYVPTTTNPQYIMATAGGQAYGAQVQGGIFVKFANDGSFTPVPGLPSLTSFYGMWGASNGHLIASTNTGLVDIDPVGGSFRVIKLGVFPDGVSVSPDGKTVYVEEFGNIDAYDVATGAPGASYPGGGRGPDGTGVISGGLFDGDIVVNNNDGTVGLIDSTTGLQTIIAFGGTRGDFVSPDTNNGTLFLSQTEQIVRLSCGPGCAFSTVPNNIPEPASIALVALGLVAVGTSKRRGSMLQ